MLNIVAGLFLAAAVYFYPRNSSASFGPFEPFGPERQQPNASDVDVMARTIWGEARSEGRAGMQAVANVIMNRYKLVQRNKNYAPLWGSTIRQICTRPAQFSVWLKDDPNYPLITTVTDKNEIFKQAKEIARQAITGTLADNTNGATFYHTKQIRPYWIVKSGNPSPVSSVGNHVFYVASQIA